MKKTQKRTGRKIQSITSCSREPSSSSEPRRRRRFRSPPSLDDDLRDGPRVFVGWMVRQARPPRHTPAASFRSSPSRRPRPSHNLLPPRLRCLLRRAGGIGLGRGRTRTGEPAPASTPAPPALLVVLAGLVKLEPVLVLVVLVEVIGEFAIGEVVVADLIVPSAAVPTTPSTAAAAAEPGRPSSGFV